MDVERSRAEMVRLLERFGIRDRRVLEAMARVPREEFVPPADRDVAYGDHALAIGEGQTISQPYVVARMTELLATRPEQRVLEVGTGSGYQAAVLAELVREVISIERHASLADAARDRLERLGYTNVRVIHADASLGYSSEAPYDRILITAATPKIDPALAPQLTADGRIVAPVGDLDLQELVVRDARGREEHHGPVKFVPLRGQAGFRG
ncbi:MAG: protein-L-isoaspartate(D-aspartate) O-methyltransferase [Candidatus Limnocylindria bacterium]